MKIIILGGGRVGASVAASLVSERNDITVIDTDPAALRLLTDKLDLRTVAGNGTHPPVLETAGIEDADMLIATAARDETNLVACQIAARVFNVPQRIARVRAPEFQNRPDITGEGGFYVNDLICPEQTVTDYISKLIEFPGALQVLEFAGGRLSLIAVRAYMGGPLVSHPIRELRASHPDIDMRIVAIFRNERSVIPEGDTKIEAGDELFLLAASGHIRTALADLRRSDPSVRRVMISGGGNIGLRLARHLGTGCEVKVIESDRARCNYLASQLPGSTLILHGDSTDETLLAEEGVAETDLFVALTSDDETNIMSCMLARRFGARRTIALINRQAYADLVEGNRIDIAIVPSQTTIGQLLTHVRRGDVVAVHSLRRGAAEALELIAHGDPQSSQVVGRRIEEIDLPRGATIGAVVRSRDGEPLAPEPAARGRATPDFEAEMAHHDTEIRSGDHVIVFVDNKRLIPKIEKLFEVSVGFF